MWRSKPRSQSISFGKALTALPLLVCPVTVLAQSSHDEEVTIIGQQGNTQAITGSAHYIGPEELREFAYSDIQRIAREVPGVSIQVEDGYGLRPNISIRGVATERSGRITLLEDNVLIAPAPYSAPSAYYFPTIGRMQAIEVVKGPAAITQGPYTIGGALNMVSTAVPNEFGGSVLLEAAEDATYRAHLTHGGRNSNGLGFLLETHQWQSDGFQSIDRSAGDTGLDVQDYTVKLSYAPEDSAHSIELKLQYAEQDSEQSYLGLSDQDFARDAYRRYGLSELDNIHTEHEQVILRYAFEVSENLSLSATAYNNKHQRDWFKTEGFDFDGSASAEDFDRTSWANVISAVNNNNSVGGFSTAQLQAVLDGTLNTAAGSVQVRSNAREYFSRGIQLAANWSFETEANTQHELQLGIRYHEDEEDRLQRNSTYSQVAGSLQLDDLGILGNAGNRVQEASALAVHLYDRIEFGSWVLTPGIRFEDIDQQRTRYRDGEARTFRDNRENDTRVVLPGFGLLYQFNEQLTLVAGAHKGFTAPSNSPGVREEEAWNYEFGLRFNSDSVRAELISFFSDYDNLLGECTASSGSDCEVGDSFNGDAASVKGIELLLSTSPMLGAWSVPLSLSYTYIDGQFDTDIADTDFFGDVSSGDPIPYIPENQFQLTAGLERGDLAFYANASYVDSVCTRASCLAFEETDSSLTIDVSANWQATEQLNLFARLENLSDEEDILGRQPYGARPNKARTAALGLRYDF